MADGDFRFEVNGFDSYDIRLGEELRGERATLGKSLLNVQKDLRIKAAYISAIENCDLNAFPNKGFIAGYVRSYARYLNLNPETTFERFCLESGYSNSIHNKSVKIFRPTSEKNNNKAEVNTQLDWRPTGIAFNDEAQHYKKSILVYFTPIFLIFALGFGIAYGSWKILVDIQKLRIVPADNLPLILSEFKLNSSELAEENPIQDSLYFSSIPETSEIKRASLNSNKGPSVKYRDGPIANISVEDVGLLGLNARKIERNPMIGSIQSSKQLIFKSTGISEFQGWEQYSTTETTSRSSNQKDSRNLLKNSEGPEFLKKEVLGLYQRNENKNSENKLSKKISKLDLNIFAIKPSWIRIKNKDEKVVFEKILKSGEVLKIENDWINGNLRAGNARDLFFSLDGVTYGPVSGSRTVIKKFKIDPDYIFETLKIHHLKDSFMNKSLSLRKSL